MKNLGRIKAKELDTKTLELMIGEKAAELHEKHGYSVEDASYFVADCYSLISELKSRDPNKPIKLL